MSDPWSIMGDDDDDETYSGPDAYVDEDDDGDLADDLDMEVQDEVEQLAEEAEAFQTFRAETYGNSNARGPFSAEQFAMLLDSMPFGNLGRLLARTTVELQGDVTTWDSTWDSEPRRSENKSWYDKVTVPQPAGVKLLASGDFGRVRHTINHQPNTNMYSRLKQIASTSRPIYKEDLVHDMVPNTNGTAVACYAANVYCGQYSADSSFYYTCCQDFWLNIYDAKAGYTPVHEVRHPGRYYGSEHVRQKTTMKIIKTIRGVHGNWTVTDAHLSPDNQRMLYSSIAPTVYMTSTLDSSMEQTPIPFSGNRDDHRSAIWCCRFSADGNEVFAGSTGPIYVYDLISDRQTVKIQDAHSDDVNSCCWADTSSGNVLISGSDDGFIKVWDRRSLGVAQKPSGVLVGHTEGITYVSAKGDGRYVISNGKDQAVRLWDLRRMRTNEEFDEIRHKQHQYKIRHFDYRSFRYPQPRVLAHPNDCSVMTYRGHEVLGTLIRCHFSPTETTGGKYLYSGSHDGRIHIWSLDGRVVQVLDRLITLPLTVDPSDPEPRSREGAGRYRSNICVRDVSWHPQEPVLMSAAWEDEESGGGSIVARHEWKGLTRGGSLEDWVDKKKEESADERARRIPELYREA